MKRRKRGETARTDVRSARTLPPPTAGAAGEQIAALQASEAHYHTLVEHSPDPMYVARNGTFLFVNPAAIRLFGATTAEDLLGTRILDRVHPAARDVVSQRIEAVTEGADGAPAVEAQFLTLDGAAIDVEVEGQAIIYDGAGAIQLVLHDISRRKRAEAALLEVTERYRRLVESAFDGYVVHQDGIIVDANAAYATMFGFTVDELLGKPVLELSPPDVRSTVAGIIQRQEHVPYETAGQRKDGSRMLIATAGMACSFLGRPARIAAVRDLTLRKLAEAQRRQLLKAESLSRMAGAIAHHFNNKLQAVIGNLEMATLELPPRSKAAHSIVSAQKAADAAADMSTLMLTYLGHTAVDRRRLDLSDVCQQCLTAVRAVMPATAVLEIDLPSPGPSVHADERQVQQILTGLLSNAWEASGDQSAVISLKVKTVSRAEMSETHRFPIDSEPLDPSYACMEVTDAGCGIADETIERVFDPFYTTKFTGREMGLSAVLGIVRAHDGLITVESEPGRGSVFRVFLPTLAGDAPR